MNKLADKDSGIIHDWVYVIIPVANHPVFCAFCKQCRQYFSETMRWRVHGETFQDSSLPKYGCQPVDAPF